MAIRDKLRKTFGGKKKEGSSSVSSSTGSDPSHYTGRTDIEYYKPHEIPKSKYRGRVDPEHQETLNAYSFSDAFAQVRRKSSQALSGVMSPGGTKSQSRRTSYMGQRSIPSTPAPNDSGNPLSRRPTLTNQPAPLIRENSDDDTDVQNTGTTTNRPTNQDNQNIPTITLERKATESQHDSDATTPANSYTYDQPFTIDELEKAMTRATMKGFEDSTIRSSIPIAAH